LGQPPWLPIQQMYRRRCCWRAAGMWLQVLLLSHSTLAADSANDAFKAKLWQMQVGEIGELEVRAGSGISTELTGAVERHLRPHIRGGGGGRLTILLGATPQMEAIVPEKEVRALPAVDAFILRSSITRGNSKRTSDAVIACAAQSPRGVGYAAFEALQQLGFAFLHPLKVIAPKVVVWPLPSMNTTESPRWEFRGTHYHTQHPLELTPLLNGRDGDNGIANRSKWQADLWMWRNVLEWMLAHKQTYFEWMLLSDRARDELSQGFELSEERQIRLTQLVTMAHAFGLEVGADIPVTLQQQHALCLVPGSTGKWEEDAARLEQRVRWVLACGFDHLGTELGSTEFTRGLTAEYQIKLLNLTQQVLGPSRRILVKNHCSTKQHADGYPDPRPGHSGTLNFNYLSYYADPRIVSMPHTVQIYSLKDPAPTYGNKDFSDLRNWTGFLLQQNRPMVFYPETAYWVNYDSSVPLFLAPIYAQTRFDDANDLDSLAGDNQVLGQLNFESGWEWGYWLGNIAQAAVSWKRFHSLSLLFEHLLRFLEPRVLKDAVDLLVKYADVQHALLIEGQGIPPAPGLGLGSATGIAYLMGSEGLSDLGGYVARLMGEGAPQPDRLLFSDLWTSPVTDFWGASWPRDGDLVPHTIVDRRSWYHDHLRPLLEAMSQQFTTLAEQFGKLPRDDGNADILEAVHDLGVSARMLGLRSTQVLALYDHAADCGGHLGDDQASPVEDACASKLEEARSALHTAMALVPDREAHYGLGNRSSQVSSWRHPNPTAYNYGYLWPVHHLFYWQRDQAIVESRIRDLCFASINDPVELGLRGGGSDAAHRWRHRLHWLLGDGPLTGCLEVQRAEPMPLQDMANLGTGLQLLCVVLAVFATCAACPCYVGARLWRKRHSRKLSMYAAAATARTTDQSTTRLCYTALPARQLGGPASATYSPSMHGFSSQGCVRRRWSVTKAAVQRRWRRIQRWACILAPHWA